MSTGLFLPLVRRLASVKCSLPNQLVPSRQQGLLTRYDNVLSGIGTDTSSVGLNQVRTFKSDLKIKWVRPEKISCILPEKSGDVGSTLPCPEPSEFHVEFQKSVELQDADELVKKIFSLEFQGRNQKMRIATHKIVDRVRRHEGDGGSMEAKIAWMTATILNLQKSMEEFPQNTMVKVKLKEIIDKRKKFLKYLRRWDYKRFEWLLEELNIVYKPPPSEFKWITRKDSLRKLTDKYCDDLRKQRLAEYKASLDAQKLDFLQKKVETLQWIREEEEACGVKTTVSQSQIDKVTEQIKQLKANENSAEDKSK